MCNQDIRATAKTAGVKLWQVAEAMGITDGNLSRKLRKELSKEEKQLILNIVSRLKGGEQDE